MSRFIDRAAGALALALLAACAAAHAATATATPPAAAAQVAAPLTKLGRAATPQEVAAWDIDVRPDFKGLPKGSGSVTAGMKVWEGKCASCHGTFGESNEVFTPIVGGVAPDDIKTGRVASLTSGKQPHKTTLMKLATVSTLWDYINRAMPWTAPKSLTTDEVYAVTAYILNMGDIVPDDFVLSDATIAQAQARMPNRNGMSTKHGMWDVRGKGDVASVACMKDCPVDAAIRSQLPEAARNAHGNLALQNRTFGAVRGIDTTRPAATASIGAAAKAMATATTAPVTAQALTVSAPASSPTPTRASAPAAASAPAPASAKPGAGLALMQTNGCTACHGVSTKVLGPSFAQVADRYRADAGAAAALVSKIKNGSSGAWGPMPMPPQSQISDADAKALVQWILGGAK